MPYIRVRDRPIEIILYKVIHSNLWQVRMPGGGFYSGGSTKEEALSSAYVFLNQWRNHPYELYDAQNPDSFHSAIMTMRARPRKKIKNLVRVVRGHPRGIAERF